MFKGSRVCSRSEQKLRQQHSVPYLPGSCPKPKSLPLGSCPFLGGSTAAWWATPSGCSGSAELRLQLQTLGKVTAQCRRGSSRMALVQVYTPSERGTVGREWAARLAPVRLPWLSFSLADPSPQGSPSTPEPLFPSCTSSLAILSLWMPPSPKREGTRGERPQETDDMSISRMSLRVFSLH
jgi:hypothetical protein